jgi:hypothetical protein
MKKILVVIACAGALAAAAFSASAETVKQHPQVNETVYAQPSIGIPVIDYAAAAEKLKQGDALGALIALLAGAGGLGLAMTTLALNKPRSYELGNRNSIPVIDNDIIYEGAAVGVVAGTGHARPLVAGDEFAGFAEQKADNTITGHTAGGIYVDLIKSGEIQLAVTGALITDVNQPVYASDDDTFTLNPADGTFVGYVKRYVSSGVVVVEFDAGVLRDPWAAYSVRETLSGTKTFDAEDCGKLFCVDAAGDGDALTLPAIAAGLSGLTILAVGAFGTTAVVVDPDNADKIHGPNLGGSDGQTITLTKATQRRGDFVELVAGDADGYMVTRLRGTWAVVA